VGTVSSAVEHEQLAAIIDRLDAQELAEWLVTSFRDEIAGYRRLPTPVITQQILDVARRNVELCFRFVADGVPPTPHDLEPFTLSARDRASEGMPLEDLLHAYRLGGRLGWLAIVDATEAEERDSLIVAAERVMHYVDAVSAAVAQAYLDERQQVVSEEERGSRDLFHALLSDAPLDTRLEALAERRGFVLAGAYRPFVLRLPGSASRRHAEVASALRRDHVLALTEGDRVAGLLAPTAEAPAAGKGLIVIAGALPRGELAAAIDEMRVVAELAESRGIGGRIDPADFALELLLMAAPRHARAIAKRVIDPLRTAEAGRSTELLTTLDEFLACGLDRRRTAEHLHVHPNTLDYRLKRIRELTDLDLRNPQHVALVVLALRFSALPAR
jgi:hypothetical protein